ncbi:MAG: acyl-CoA dehydrogenase family protein, partial [Actinomycetota bacterium]
MTSHASEATRVNDALDELLAGFRPDKTDPKEFWGDQFDAGLAWVDYPLGDGGLGVSPSHRATVARRLADAGAPTWNRTANVLGIGMGSGVLIAHGTPEQRKRWLRPMFTMDEI